MSAFCGISLAIVARMSRIHKPLSLIYALAFAAFVVWRWTKGGFDLTQTVILVADTLIATFNP